MEPNNPTAPNFNLFLRQHSQIVGTGVGLYLVQRIVTSQGGRIEVASTISESTNFIIMWKLNDYVN